MVAKMDKNKKASSDVENSTAQDVRILQISYNKLEIENEKFKKELQALNKKNEKTAKDFSKMIQFYQTIKQENHRIKLQNRLLMAEFDSLKLKLSLDDASSTMPSDCDEDQEINNSDNERYEGYEGYEDYEDYDAEDELDISQKKMFRNPVRSENLGIEIFFSDRRNDGLNFNKETIHLSTDHIINSSSANYLPNDSSTGWLVLICSLLLVYLQLLVLNTLLHHSDDGIFAGDPNLYCIFDNHYAFDCIRFPTWRNLS